MRGKGIIIGSDYNPIINVERDTSGKIVRGLTIGATLYQNQALILLFRPGYVKTSPTTGVGINDLLLDFDQLAWRRKIRKQMEQDNQKVNSVEIKSKNVLIDAHY